MGRKNKQQMEEALERIKKKRVKIKNQPRSKTGGANDTPSRRKYWASGILEKRKIKAIMKNFGLTRAEASLKWHSERKGRMR